MNFGEGFTFPEENELQLFGDSRIPATPIKPIATRTQRRVLVDGQGNQLGISNRQEQSGVFNGSVQNCYLNIQLGRSGGLLSRNVSLSNPDSGFSSQYAGLLNQKNGISNNDVTLSTPNVNLLRYDARARLANHYASLSNQNAGVANSGASLSSQYPGLSSHKFNLSNQNTGMPNHGAGLSNQCTALSNQDVGFINGDIGFSNQNSGFPNQELNLLTRHVGISNQNASSLNRDVSFSNQNIALSNRDTGFSNQNPNISIREAGLSNRGVAFPNQNSGMLNNYAGVSNQNVVLSNQISGMSNDAGFLNRDMGLSNHSMGLSKEDAGLSNRDMGLTNNNMELLNHNTVISNRGVVLSKHHMDVGLSNQNMGLSIQGGRLSNGNVDQSNQGVRLPIGHANQSNQEVSLPQRHRVINHVANTYKQTPDFDNAGANNITLADLLAFRNAGSASAATSTIIRNNNVRIMQQVPNMQAQAKRHQNQLSTIEMLPVNNSYCQSTSLLNNSENYTNNTEDGIPTSNRPLYNLNAPPTAASDASATSSGNPFCVPGYNQQSDQDQLDNILDFYVDKILNQETNKLDELLAASMGGEVTEESDEEHLILQSIVHPSSVDVASLDETNKDNEQGIDLNKTPQPKIPKRRKHRPKVVRESKPKSGPKPVIPNDSSTKQTPTAKRKHVSRNEQESTTPKENVTDKTVDPPVETGAKSCRRALNFDFEKSTDESVDILDSHTNDAQNRNESCINLNINAGEREECSEPDKFCGKESAPQMNLYTNSLSHFKHHNPCNCVEQNQYYPQPPAALQDIPVKNTSILRNKVYNQHSAPNGTGQSVDYGSVYQKKIHSEGLGQIFFQPKRTEENLDGSRKAMLQSSPQSVLHNMVDSNEERAYKRKYQPTMDRINHETATMHSLLCQEVINVDEYDEHLSNLREGVADAQKRRRYESELNMKFPSIMCSVKHGSRQHTPNGANGLNMNLFTTKIIDTDLSSHKESNNTPTKISHGENRFTLDRYHPPQQNGYRKQYNSTQLVPYMPSTVYMQSQRSTQDNNTTSMNGKCNYSPLPPHKRTPTSSGMKEVERSAKTSANITKGPSSKALLPGKNVNHNTTFHHMNKGLSERESYLVLIDEIITRFAFLKLDKGNESVRQEEKALVPYKADSTIIPYKGYQIKKKPPRPKVNLDPESERLWKVLIGKEQAEANEGTDKDKEKWWEEERRVFRGRADSFIARMHLVQGDRRFSRWKGSVVDSVIGVFLTQNVSDHLSSSAFMSLAARFPIRPSSNIDPSCYRSEKPILVEEPELSILGTDDTLRQHEKVLHQPVYHQIPHLFQESLDEKRKYLNLGSESTSLVKADDETQEEVISATKSVHTFIQHVNGELRMISVSREEAKERGLFLKPVQTFDSVSRNPVPPRKVGITRELHSYEYDKPLLNENEEHNHTPAFSTVDSHSVCLSSAYIGSNVMLHDNQRPAVLDTGISRRDDVSSQPYNASSICSSKDINPSYNVQSQTEGIYNHTLQLNGLLRQQATFRARLNAQSTSHPVQKQSVSHQGNFKEINQQQSNNTQQEMKTDFHWKNTFITGSVNNAEKVDARGIGMMHEKLKICNLEQEASDIRTDTVKNKAELPNKKSEQKTNVQNHSFGEATKEKTTTTLKAPKGKTETGKKSEMDWDGLRKQVQFNFKKDRTADRMDSLDYEAVRCADVKQISDTIKERGMNNMLAERMQAFLNRLVEDHGGIDLEWLRDAPPDKAKEYLLSIWGLEAQIRESHKDSLGFLKNPATKVDTNVGRIAVRLGWVPLQPLPESLQLHLLEMYPVLESIQKYLWPRLCKLDQRTLYELHYQMITFGKVFCTKSRPNCNACPMRGECRHFASAFASARLALPGPEEKGIVKSGFLVEGERIPTVVINPVPLLTPGEDNYSRGQCEPIIEVPATPEQESLEITESDIEDAFYEDSEEIPTIKLNVEELTQNLQYYMQETSQDGDMSKALVALNAAAAVLPTPKLKNVSRLRTEHQVYELPDSHPLLKGLDRREPDDPSPYLLAIWAPGETADSTLPTENMCTSQDPNKLCDIQTCFSCNSKREANSLTVKGTLLIPCRTAMRGSFPLNGTYFQVNEMFADDESSKNPIAVPRAWIWNLQRRTVYFGTSVSTIFRGLTTEGIQYCFWRGFVCVRGFDQQARTPRPLRARLHFPASRLAKNRNEKK